MAVDAINSYVVERIRQHRMEQGLTVAVMAKRAGIPLGSYSCLETNRYRLNLQNLFRVQAVLGVEVESLWPSPDGPVEQVTGGTILEAVEKARKRLPERITYRDVLQKVCEVYAVTRRQLASPSRRRYLAEARTVALVLVREQPHLTLVGLSRLLKRDVSSLSHCLRRLNPRLEYDRQLRARLDDARQAVARAHGEG